ncbi:MAG: hypothetical protein HON76_06635, partial [Candidatus Scalindua sp.]|nr:hypothetical protein [Candidatus Scalindua sp.]
MKRILITLCLSLLFTATVPVGVVNAASKFWNVANGDWSGTNWNSGIVWPPQPNVGEPGSGDTAYIDNGGTAQITQSGETAVNVFLGSLGGSSGSINMSAGSLSTTSMFVGHIGTGSFIQSGGTVTLSSGLILGNNPTAVGSYNLSSGSLFSNSQSIGHTGTGTFTQSGGTNSVSLSGLNTIGSGSSGIYNLSGGAHIVGDLTVGNGTGSGTYNLSGGTLDITG